MKILRKSRNKKISGVLGGFAEYFEVDATLVRIVFVILALITVGFPFLIGYIIAAFLMKD